MPVDVGYGLCMGNVDWSQAGCQDKDRELFYAENMTPKRAKALCAGCPIIEQCKEYAVLHEPYGVWGGMTVKQRSEFRNRNPQLALEALREGRLQEEYCLVKKEDLEEAKVLLEIMRQAPHIPVGPASESLLQDLEAFFQFAETLPETPLLEDVPHQQATPETPAPTHQLSV